MKKIFFILVLLLTANSSWSQEYTWSQLTNPDFGTSNANSCIVMAEGKLYQFHFADGVNIRVGKYDPFTSAWSTVGQTTPAGYITKMHAVYKNNLIYLVAVSSLDYVVYTFDPISNILSQASIALTAPMPASNTKMKAGYNNDLYLLRVENYANIYLSRYDITTNTWTDNANYTTLLNPTSDFSVSSEQLELYISNTSIYCGASTSALDRIGVTTPANLGIITPYNSAGSNDAQIYINSSLGGNKQFYFTGDGISEPIVHVKDLSLNKTWETPITTTNININTTITSLDFNVYQFAFATLENPAYSFLLSSFQPIGGGTPDKFYVYRKDIGTGIWDSLGPKVRFGDPSLNSGTLSMSLDNAEQHLAVQFASGVTNGQYEQAVLNRKPFLGVGTDTPNSNICVGHDNEIYPQLEYYDYDMDPVRIVNVTSRYGVITNLSAVANGQYVTNPSLSKFKVYGHFTSSAPDEVIITYTDGWNTFMDTLPSISTSTSAPNITFSSSPLVLCNNENLIDLVNYVSYVDQGVFTLNGIDLPNSVFDGRVLSQTNPNGTIYYRVSVGGCIVETGVTFSFATVGTATASATPSDCSAATGTAQVTFNPGTSTNTTVEWSTGEVTTNIANLTPGAYYYAIKDEFGCNVTGFTDVPITGISATASTTNVSCYGANDGSLTLNVIGSTNYSVLWSNGYSTNTISNLAPGNYEATIFDVSGCQATYSFLITEPTQITASFSTYEPDCGIANGSITGTYAGGAGGYSYNWVGQGQLAPNLTGVTYGFYQVIVTDALGCSNTFDYQLDDYQAIDIADSIIDATCGASNGAILIDFVPDVNSGFLTANSFSWSNNNAFEDNFNLAPNSYTITAVSGPSLWNGNMCYSVKTMTVGYRAPVLQEICMVTVDTTTSTNIVVWEKIETSGIDYYNIYRENAVAGNFMLIDTVQATNESLFNDVVASPLDRSWRYKISAVNDCGIEGPISSPHKTIHLNSIVNLGNGSNDIFWDDYEGLTELEYIVWRHTDQNGWEALAPAVPFGTSVFNDVPPAGSTGIDYYVDMDITYPCTAEKAQDFNSARSNKEKGQFSPGEGTGDSNNDIEELIGNASIGVYPNPFTDLLTIQIEEATTAIDITVYSIDGQLQYVGSFENGTSLVDLKHLKAGMYLIQLGSAAHTKQFVKL